MSSPPFFLRDGRTIETRARVKITPTRKGDTRRGECRLFSLGVIFTRACVSLSLYYPEEKWGTTRSLILGRQAVSLPTLS